MKNNFFLKLLMLMMGVSVFGVVEGEAGGSGSESTGESEGEGDTVVEPKGTDKEKTPDKSISDNEAKLLRELMEKKGSLKEAKTELEQVKAQLKQFDGINLDEVKQMLKEREELTNKQLEAKGEWDRLKANLLEQHNAEKVALQERIEALQAELSGKDQAINGLTIGSAFSASKFIAEEMTLTPSKAQIIYGSHFEYQDGQIVAYDKPKGAQNRTQLIDAKGEPLHFEVAIAKLVELDQDKDRLIRSKAKPGANSNAGEGPAKPAQRDLSGMARIADALSKK